MFDDAAARLATSDIHHASYKVAFALMKVLDSSNWRMLHQEELGARLNLSAATISRAVKDLLQERFIERRGLNPRAEYRLCAESAWRGGAARFHEAVREIEAERRGAAPAEVREGEGVVSLTASRQRRLALKGGKTKPSRVRPR